MKLHLKTANPAGAQHRRPLRLVRLTARALGIMLLASRWAVACDPEGSGYVTTPLDAKLTVCVPWGWFQPWMCQNYEYWDYGVTNYVAHGKKLSVSYRWVDSGWVENDGDTLDPDVWAYPYPSPAHVDAFYVGRSPEAESQDIVVTAKGWVSYRVGGILTVATWSQTGSFHIVNDGSCSSPPCAGPPGPSHPVDESGGGPVLATARVSNSVGHDINFGLGPISFPDAAGLLALNMQMAPTNLYDPGALYVPHLAIAPQSMDVVTNTNGVISQVNVPQGLMNVAVTGSNSYQLQFFYSNNVTAKSGGLYGTNAPAFATWTISNPNSGNSNQILLTLTRPGITDPQYTYTLTNVAGINQWQLTDSGGIRTIASWEAAATNPTYGTVTSRVVQVLSGTNVVKSTQKTYAMLGGFRSLIQQIDGSGTATNVTSHTYNSSNWLERSDYPDGRWEHRLYDTNRRVTTNFSAYLNFAPPAVTNCPNPLTDHCRQLSFITIHTSLATTSPISRGLPGSKLLKSR